MQLLSVVVKSPLLLQSAVRVDEASALPLAAKFERIMQSSKAADVMKRCAAPPPAPATLLSRMDDLIAWDV